MMRTWHEGWLMKTGTQFHRPLLSLGLTKTRIDRTGLPGIPGIPGTDSEQQQERPLAYMTGNDLSGKEIFQGVSPEARPPLEGPTSFSYSETCTCAVTRFAPLVQEGRLPHEILPLHATTTRI